MNNLKECYIFVLQRIENLQNKTYRDPVGLSLEESETLMIYTILREMLEQMMHDNKDKVSDIPKWAEKMLNS